VERVNRHAPGFVKGLRLAGISDIEAANALGGSFANLQTSIGSLGRIESKFTELAGCVDAIEREL
jgi:hypothetical protein